MTMDLHVAWVPVADRQCLRSDVLGHETGILFRATGTRLNRRRGNVEARIHHVGHF